MLNRSVKKPKKGVKVKFKFNLWKIVIVFLIFMFFAPFFISILQVQIDESQIDISQVVVDIKDGKVEEVVIQDQKLFLTYFGEEEPRTTTKEPGLSFAELLDRSGIDPTTVNYKISDQALSRAFGEILITLMPIGLMVLLFVFIFRKQSKGVQDVFSFGKSKAKMFAKGKQTVNFGDVAGVDDAKQELEEIVDFLRNPAKYRVLGARTPKGVLLFGPAGVGKTLLARAVAGEAKVPFFSIAGSEFMEMLVGVGASRVRDLFSQAKTQAPSIIFIDEIDAIGRARAAKGFVGGHDEREQTLNQILVEMDGFTPNDNVIVVAATNRGDLLDPALLRPGRFDRRVTLDMPDKDGRLAILKIHARGKKFGAEMGWDKVASRTVGFSGADLENMLNEAAIHAARAGKREIDMDDVEEAATKVKLGPAKRKLQSKEDKRITAYHEAGHAIVTHYLTKTDPVHRISIVARGMSLGHTLIPPAADRTHDTKSRILQHITAMLGGRAAEEVVLDDMTSGASSDIAQATKLARAMVVDFGMSKLGTISMGTQVSYDEFGGADWMEKASVSPALLEKIDEEVKAILDNAHDEAIKLIKENRKDLDKVVEELIKEETIGKEEFEKLVGKKPSRESKE